MSIERKLYRQFESASNCESYDKYSVEVVTKADRKVHGEPEFFSSEKEAAKRYLELTQKYDRDDYYINFVEVDENGEYVRGIDNNYDDPKPLDSTVELAKSESTESDFAFEQGKVRFNEVVKSMCTSLSVFDARKSVKSWVSVDKCVDKLTEAINIARSTAYSDEKKAQKFMELIEQAQHELDADREWQDMAKSPNKTYQQEKEELDKKVIELLESMPQVVDVEPDTKYGFYNVTLKAVYCEPENLKKFYDEADKKIKQELPNDSDDIMITTLDEEGKVVDY